MVLELHNKDCLEVFRSMEDESVDLVVTDCPYKIVSGGCTITPRKDEMKGMLNKRSRMVEIHNADCLNVLSRQEDNSIDLLVTDCPYLIAHHGGPSSNPKTKSPSGMLNLNTSQDVRDGKLFKHNEIKFSEWLPEIARVLKPESHAYIMVNGRNLCELQTEATKSGVLQFQQLLVWKKNTATPNKWYMNACEFILMLRKGKAKNIKNMGAKNLLEVPNVKNKQHPTEKPVELMEILIENSSDEGDVVLDPFMGAGSTGVAAKNLGRGFIGIEIDEQYFKIAQERLLLGGEDVHKVEQPTLF